MTGKDKLTDDELLDVIAEQAIDDEADRIAQMSDAEVDAELAAAGVDPATIHAKGAEIAAKMSGEQKPPAPVKRAAASRRFVLLAAAALLLLTFVAVLLTRDSERAPLPIGPEPSVAVPVPSVSEKLVQPAVDAAPWDEPDSGPLKPPMRR